MSTGTVKVKVAVAAATIFLAPVSAHSIPRPDVPHYRENTGEGAILTYRPKAIAYSNSSIPLTASTQHDAAAAPLGVEFMKTVTDLRELRDGWLGESSLAPTSVAIDELVAAHTAIDAEARISPAADGSIVVEWESHDREYLVSIERDNSIVFVEEDQSGVLISEKHVPYSSVELQQLLSAGSAT